MYILDTNFFVTAHRQHYPLDIVPSFWKKVSELSAIGHICSIDKVLNELNRGNDTLIEWVECNLPQHFFLDSTQFIVQYSTVAQWAQNRSLHYHTAAINKFLEADEADAWLVAAAITTGGCILTHEKSNPAMKNRIAIPEPCDHFGLKYCDTMGMFRKLGITI